MAKRLPDTLFVKRENDGGTEYFTADEDVTTLVSTGEKLQLGRYKLVETTMATGIVKLDAFKKR